MDVSASKQLNIVIPAFRWHSQSFLMLVEGISEEDALRRINGVTNHLIWMVGNFLNFRYLMGNVLGLKAEDPFNDLFFQGKTLDDSIKYPTLSELKASFYDISPRVYQHLLSATDDQLEQDFPMEMNISFLSENVLNAVGMCIGREDQLCGQMALMRRILGYPGVSYQVDESLSF